MLLKKKKKLQVKIIYPNTVVLVQDGIILKRIDEENL